MGKNIIDFYNTPQLHTDLWWFYYQWDILTLGIA